MCLKADNFGNLPPSYVELFSEWETLYYNGFLFDEEYGNNPFPL